MTAQHHVFAPHGAARSWPLCTRRQWLALTFGASAAGAWALPARTLQFPPDHGSHPDLHTEWWYLTGHARAAGRLAESYWRWCAPVGWDGGEKIGAGFY